MSLFPSPLVAALGAGGLIPFCALSKPGAAQLDVDNRLGPLRQLLGRPSLNATELQVTDGGKVRSLRRAPPWGSFVCPAGRAAGGR